MKSRRHFFVVFLLCLLPACRPKTASSALRDAETSAAASGAPVTRSDAEALGKSFVDKIAATLVAVAGGRADRENEVASLSTVYAATAPVFSEFGLPNQGAGGAYDLFAFVRAGTGRGLYVHKICGYYAVKSGKGAKLFFPNLAIGALATSEQDQTPMGLLFEVLNEYLELGPNPSGESGWVVLKHGVDFQGGDLRPVQRFPWPKGITTEQKAPFFEQTIAAVATFNCGSTGNAAIDTFLSTTIAKHETDASASWDRAPEASGAGPSTNGSGSGPGSPATDAAPEAPEE